MIHMHEDEKEDVVKTANYKILEAKLSKAKIDLRIELDKVNAVNRMADEFIFQESAHK